jgi:hypothetical protein
MTRWFGNEVEYEQYPSDGDGKHIGPHRDPPPSKGIPLDQKMHSLRLTRGPTKHEITESEKYSNGYTY